MNKQGADVPCFCFLDGVARDMTQHPVVVAAIDKLAKSCAPESGISNQLDRSKTVGLFYALLDHGYQLDSQFVFERLLESGWLVERADDVADLAELVSVDGYVKEDPPLGWGERVVNRILADLA